MKILICLFSASLMAQVGCISGDSVAYVEGTYDEYYRLHWLPFVKEYDKDVNEKRYERRQAEPETCSKETLVSLPKDCEEGSGRKKRRSSSGRRF